MTEFEQLQVEIFLQNELERKRQILQASLILMAAGFFFYLMRGLVSYATKVAVEPWAVTYLPEKSSIAELATSNIFLIIAGTLTSLGGTMFAIDLLLLGNLPVSRRMLATIGIIILAQKLLSLIFGIIYTIILTISAANSEPPPTVWSYIMWAIKIAGQLLYFILLMVGLLVLRIAQNQERRERTGSSNELMTIVGAVIVLGLICVWSLAIILYYVGIGTLHKTFVTMVTLELLVMTGMTITTIGAILCNCKNMTLPGKGKEALKT